MMTYKDSWWAPYIGLVAAIWIVLAAASIGLGIWGLLLMNTSKVDKVRKGSILVLIAALSAFPTGWGFMIGSILMLIGGIQGLRWRPGGVEKN